MATIHCYFTAEELGPACEYGLLTALLGPRGSFGHIGLNTSGSLKRGPCDRLST